MDAASFKKVCTQGAWLMSPYIANDQLRCEILKPYTFFQTSFVFFILGPPHNSGSGLKIAENNV